MKQRLKFLVLSCAVASVLILIPSLSSAFSKSRKPATSNKILEISAADLEVAPTLDQVLDRNLSGLPADPAQLEILRAYSEQYVQARKSRSTPSCSTKLAQVNDPFCNLVPETTLSGPTSRRFPKLSRAAARKLAEDLKHGNFEKLQDTPEPRFMSALKTFAPEEYEKTALLALETPTCPSTALLTTLGLKLEEKLPDPGIQQLLSRIYERTIVCSDHLSEDDSAIKAAYRLSLHRIAAGDYAKAEELLSKITDSASAFRTRILYWRYICAQKLENSAIQEETRAILLREAPLSLHSLMLSGANLKLTTPSLNNIEEPRVFFRSRVNPELNSTILASELLQAANQPELMFKVLSPALDKLQDTEPQFQLYVAILLMRSGDVLKKFQLITSLFREYPSFISNASMRMLYPLRSLELMDHLPTSDPFLIVSLIRQESAFNHKARSPAGALGLMQLMPMTARKMERRTRKQQLFNPQVNVRIGVKYFNLLMERYDNAPELALAAYNAGPERVDDWVKRYPVEDRMLFVDLIPYRETREYVASIVRNYYFYLKLYEQEWQRRSPRKPVFGKSALFSFMRNGEFPNSILNPIAR